MAETGSATNVSGAPVASGAPPRRRSLRVCHLAYSFYDGDNRVMRYVEELAGRGDEVDVITLRAPGQPYRTRAGGVQFYRIQRREVGEKSALAYFLKLLWFFVKAACLLSVLQMRRRYDVVHVHNVPEFLVFAAAVPKLAGASIILDIHDIVPELYVGKFGVPRDSRVFRWLLRVERWSCRFADHVIVANHLWHGRLIQRAVSADKCTTILNYPDLRIFSPLPADRRRQDGKFIILYPGSLNYHQGVEIAVRAFARVKDRMPDAEFHIYGSGPTRGDLVRLAKESGLAEVVKVRDNVPLKDVSSLIGSADVGVVPKRAEGFGDEAFSTKILEFMACGVPVVVSKTRVDSHYFDDTLVRFFTPGDDADLARALLWVYENRSHHGAWIRAEREFALRNSWQVRYVDYFGVIDALMHWDNIPVTASAEGR